KGQRLFDFGTGDNECFYLTLSDNSGKPVLVAMHDGKTCRLTSAKAVPADQWVDVRVELSGSEASLYVDRKRVTKGAFRFKPRDVFIGDRAEGNFIGCDRNHAGFFKGRIDYFRIYRKTHDDFQAIGKRPPDADRLSAEWTRRRIAKEKELAEISPLKDLSKEAEELNRRRSQLLETSDKLTELNDRRRTAGKEKAELDRTVLDKFNALADTVGANKEIAALREKIDALRKNLPKLLESLKADHPDLSKLETSLKQKQKTFEETKGAFLTRQTQAGELKGPYKKVLAALDAVDRAIVEEKERMVSENVAELAEIGRRLYEIENKRKHWRYDGQGLAIRRAGMSRNPFANSAQESILTLHEGLEYRTTADWDYRTRQEVRGDVPPTMKEWLERVRGY
ncbi:MAG: hypothetical protein HQ581_06630, partial [Planctomycetes bacterium]|nr:hypothetical protein [Planctomycetota bacterium]